MSIVKCDKSEKLLNEEKKETTVEPSTHNNDDEPNISTCLTKVPGMGLMHHNQEYFGRSFRLCC